MWYKGKMVLSVASYNFLRWHKNARVVTTFLLDFILCYLLTDKAVQFAVERDTTMQIFEAFIWTFGDSNAILLVSLLLLILFADMPFITTATPFYLMRTTRRVWVVGQMVYVALATMLFMVFTLFSTVVLTMQNAFTGNRWSRTAAALAYSGSGKELNSPSAVKAIEMSRPWQSMLWVLALMLLYTLVMVLVMLLFNIWKGQMAGIAAVISFSCYGLLLNPDNIKKVLHLPDQLSYKARVLVGWISPLNQATFYMHNFGYDKLPTLGQTVAIGLALLAVLLILTICAIRRYAFSFSGTEGK